MKYIIVTALCLISSTIWGQQEIVIKFDERLYGGEEEVWAMLPKLNETHWVNISIPRNKSNEPVSIVVFTKITNEKGNVVFQFKSESRKMFPGDLFFPGTIFFPGDLFNKLDSGQYQLMVNVISDQETNEQVENNFINFIKP